MRITGGVSRCRKCTSLTNNYIRELKQKFHQNENIHQQPDGVPKSVHGDVHHAARAKSGKPFDEKDKQTLTGSLAMSCARSTFQYNRLVKGTRQDGTALQEEPLNLIYVDTHQSIQAGKALQILFKCQPGAEQTRQRHSPQGDRSWGLSLPSASSRSSHWAR